MLSLLSKNIVSLMLSLEQWEVGQAKEFEVF